MGKQNQRWHIPRQDQRGVCRKLWAGSSARDRGEFFSCEDKKATGEDGDPHQASEQYELARRMGFGGLPAVSTLLSWRDVNRGVCIHWPGKDVLSAGTFSCVLKERTRGWIVLASG